MAIRAKARGLRICVTMIACGALDPVPWEKQLCELVLSWTLPGAGTCTGQVPAGAGEARGGDTPPVSSETVLLIGTR